MFDIVNKKRGISLITLVITIIVIIILAGAVILSLQKSNPIQQASKAKFLNDVATFKEDLELYKQNQYLKNNGQFDPDTLYAPVEGLSIYDVIPSLENSSYGKNDFKVEKGQLIYQGTNKDYQDWSKDANVEVDKGQVKINIAAMQSIPVKAGVDVVYSIQLDSASNITDNNLDKNIVVIDKDGNEITTQPTLTYSEYTGTDTEKTVEVTISTTGMSDGQYRLKVKAGAVNNSVKVANDETISSDSFTIDSSAPNEEISYTISPEGYTNTNVTLTLNKAADVAKIMYGEDDSCTNEYNGAIAVNVNGTIYVKAIDAAGNEGTVQTIAISNIDKEAPTAAIDASVSEKTINATITISDNGQIDYAKSKYMITESSIAYGAENSIWNNATAMTQSSEIISQTEEPNDYYIQVLAVDQAGNKEVVVSNKVTVVNDEYPKYSESNAVDNTTIDGKKPAYNDPVIPKGFTTVNDGTSWSGVSKSNTSTSGAWNQGLVIQDSAGNQFVWVPVDGTKVTYVKWDGEKTNISYSSTSDDSFPENLDETTLAKKYGGFYIARYEASINNSNGIIKAESKKSTGCTTSDWSSSRNNSTYNGYLWNWINYADAKKYSESMDTGYGYDTNKVGTNLVTGTEWDTAMKWIQNAGYDVSKDSGNWGNYSDSVSPANVSGYGRLQVTGYSEYWKAKNIYDLAGNVWEWTNEKYSSHCVRRGGGYYGNSSYDPAAYRYGDSSADTDNHIGFRFALYIK